MAGELIRPGVEVIQQFTSASPSFVRPTLVPCVVGPAFEVLNVLTSDGTLNSKALSGSYTQLAKALAPSALPDPRSNIDELSIESSTISPYILFSGKLSKLPMDPGSAFLCTIHKSSKAAMRSAEFASAGATKALSGTSLTFCLDQAVRTNRTNDITVVFSDDLTAEQTASEINAEVGLPVASAVSVGSGKYRVQIASTTYGALSSVTVRSGGSANSILELGYSGGSATYEERVEGSGFRAQDQGNNTTQSSWVEFFRGEYLLIASDGTVTKPSFPADRVGLIGIESQSFVSQKEDAVVFADSGYPVKAGDLIYFDGVRAGGGEIMRVEPDRIKIGTINTALSVADSNGNYTTKVYNEVKFGTIFDDNPLSPVYSYVKANGLYWEKLAPVADSFLGATTAAPACHGYIQTGTITVPTSLAGSRVYYTSTVNGVETESYYVITGGPFSTVSGGALGTDIQKELQNAIPGVTVVAGAPGTLKFVTNDPGSKNIIMIKGTGLNSANTLLSLPVVDTYGAGKDPEFYGFVSIALGAVPATGDLVLELSSDDFATVSSTLTFTFAAEPDLATLVTNMNAALNPDVYVQLIGSDKILIRRNVDDSRLALKVKSTTSAGIFTYLGVSSGQVDQSLISAQSLSFTLDSNPHVYTTTFTSPSLAEAVSEINSTVGSAVASVSGSGSDQLKLMSTLLGKSSLVSVQSGTAASILGLSGAHSSVGAGRPFPDAYLDGASVLHIGPQILRDQVSGYPMDQSVNIGSLYIQYKALRKDVSALAKTAGVVRLSDTTALSQVLDPLTEDNPLGLAAYLCMINCPGFEVKLLGIDDVSAAAPEGTSAAWARALSLLEAEEVYAIAPLTQDEVVHGLVSTHVKLMSAPEQGGERIAFISKVSPTRKNPSIVVSGTKSESTLTNNQLLLDSDPSAGLVALGINPGLPIQESALVYVTVEVGGELRRYSVSSVSGPLVSFRTSFSSSETNADGFFSTVTLDVSVVDAPYSMEKRGDSLAIPGTNPEKLDYSLVAETVAGANEGFKNRRLFSVFPETVKTTVNGTEKSLPSYYAAACIAGMVGAQPAQQGFTNLPITGLTGVVGTENYTKRQQNVMAGGGTYILVQDNIGGPVSCRHQLSTDLTSIETRELSITKVVDITAKILRLSVRKYIGTNNVDGQLLDTLSTNIQAVLKFLQDAGVLLSSSLNSIAQDTTSPDTVLVDVTVQVPYPCNYIRIVLVV